MSQLEAAQGRSIGVHGITDHALSVIVAFNRAIASDLNIVVIFVHAGFDVSIHHRGTAPDVV